MRVALRFALLCGQAPVSANLFHHAVEMYLKGAPVRKMGPVSLDEARGQLRNLGHNMTRVWKRFKRVFPGASLDNSNGVVKNLHEFEKLRYPDPSVLDEGMEIQFARRSGEVVPDTLSRHEPCLEAVDALVQAVYNTACVNPTFRPWPDEAKGNLATRVHGPFVPVPRSCVANSVIAPDERI
ncbi:hypothetical protein [Paraburkholderia sp. 32]|uniref:hypothetical protein n=1 Tax=unclassified Paraburkholderia TaxID=2615204 RepID=UPI003D1EAB3F